MSHELGNKERIYQLLQKEPLTSIEIANKLTINEDCDKNIQFIRIYLQRLIKANLIKSKKKKERYHLYTVIEKGLDGDGLLDGNSNSVMKDFKRLYQIMNAFLLPKINENKIAEIPHSVLEELENLEEEYNFE